MMLNELITKFYAIRFEIEFYVKKWKFRHFMKANPDYVFMFTKEADKRLDEYISKTDIRLKRLAASILKSRFTQVSDIMGRENLSRTELDYLQPLIQQIKKELKLV